MGHFFSQVLSYSDESSGFGNVQCNGKDWRNHYSKLLFVSFLLEAFINIKFILFKIAIRCTSPFKTITLFGNIYLWHSCFSSFNSLPSIASWNQRTPTKRTFICLFSSKLLTKLDSIRNFRRLERVIW